MKVAMDFSTGVCTIELDALEAADILMDKDGKRQELFDAIEASGEMEPK